ncbi:MAG: hypothetical protein A2Y77_09200 [Planctomycetes bacterium RBG_13_62_9]|nr:MAG: hypothetical protein A2Y77_09200 [Planctomycetes bacterium RBG_13_62_9]
MRQRTAIVIGAGPGGLTAASELLTRTDIRPIVFEMSDVVGGISRTVNYKGNRIDIGGHRLFSKSRRVVDWWLDVLPLQGRSSWDGELANAAVSRWMDPDGPDPEQTDRVMLVRERRSSIFYAGNLFNYPICASLDTVRKLGGRRTLAILASYLRARALPIRNEKSLEDFFINRFGKVLYRTFFKDYTEKLWGIACDQISPEWGVQRVKGLSVSRALLDAWRHALPRGVAKSSTETSLIRCFLYPKLGPGQLWSEVTRRIEKRGGAVQLGHKVIGLTHDGSAITSAAVRDEATGRVSHVDADCFFSTMPIRDLIAGLTPSAPAEVKDIAAGLAYRDFITVGLLAKKLEAGRKEGAGGGAIRDCWLYIHDPLVKMGRIQLFHNWSPYLLRDAATVWIGVEYFCNEGDALWNMSDSALAGLAIGEAARIGLLSRADMLDSTVIRMPKAYPAYTGAYRDLGRIRDYANGFDNLFLIGRNGMHRYNNIDHSMLSAIVAVDNIVHGMKSKDNIWQVNTEGQYHEAACDGLPEGMARRTQSLDAGAAPA